MLDVNTIILIASLSTGLTSLILFGIMKKLRADRAAVKPRPIPIRRRGSRNDVL